MTSVSINPKPIYHIVKRHGVMSMIALAVLIGLGGCESRVFNHGHSIDEVELNAIKIGESTRIDLLSTLGKPSFEGAFRSDKIYYVSQFMIEPPAGRKATETRQLFAFTFNENDVVTAVDMFDEATGKLVLHLDEKTPTPGDNLGVIDQIFSNLKRRRAQE